MKFVSIRDLRYGTAAVRAALKAKHAMVVTRNGGPFAILAEIARA